MRGSKREELLSPRSSKSKLNLNASSLASHNKPVLYLKRSCASFNAPSKRDSIFFDECNQEIISLTSNIHNTSPPSGTLLVSQRTDLADRIELTLPVGKRILSVKINSNRSVIAYHVERNIIEFINIKQATNVESSSSCTSQATLTNASYILEEKRYFQSSRAKNSKLIGFLWTGQDEVVLITDLSVEYYHVNSGRRRVNLIKVFQSDTNWFVYQPLSKARQWVASESDENAVASPSPVDQDAFSLLIVSTGSLGSSLQPYVFCQGRVSKLMRFEVEGNWQESDRLELFERSITIGCVYGLVRLLVLQHESLNVLSKGAQIVMYTVDTKSGITSKTHTLDLDTSGRFAINILDNLVIVHDQPSKTSFIFDIAIKCTEKSDCPKHYVSLIDSRPMRQISTSTEQINSRSPDLYSLNWVFFQPNFIIDAKLGILFVLNIDLQAMQDVLQDNNLFLNFLVRRSNSEKIMLKRCKEIVLDSYYSSLLEKKHGEDSTIAHLSTNTLAEVSSAFEILSQRIRPALELALVDGEKSSSNDERTDASACLSSSDFQPALTIHQEDVDRDIFRHLFDAANDNLTQPVAFHFVSSVLLEFIFSIRCQDNGKVEFCIYERLVRCLVRAKRFFQIIQMIRSEMLKDSKQLACLLISLRDQYKPASQLGLDMFHRLPCGPPPADLAELMQG